jgi:hypothetical protein
MIKKTVIKQVFRKAWDRKTCFPQVKDQWNEDLPELGQCAVTALILQDKFGGEIVYNKKNNHFWNKLPSGEFLDLTRAQFRNSKITVDLYVDRSEILESKEAKLYRTKVRYNLLKKKVSSELRVSVK